jgi:hypothetical protein
MTISAFAGVISMTREAVRPLVSLAAFSLLAGCVSNIKQDAHSGPDGRAKGASIIKLDDDGEGSSKGIVTYPGGDRVDWKVFEIQKPGDVEIALKWVSPRPNLDLSMNILDDTFHVVKRLAPADGSKQRKSAELPKLQPGKYYVQVYASTRGDAGEYEVDVKWTEARATVAPIVNAEPIPNPPRLPAVPGVVAAKDGGGGGNGIPEGQPGSKSNPCQTGQACPPNAFFINMLCPEAGGMPQGTPCPPKPVINPACPEAGPLLPETPCPQKARAAKIIERQISGSETVVTLDKGSQQGIGKGWTGIVYVGKTGTKLLKGSEFTIFKVTEDESYGKIRLPIDTLGENFRVELKSPPQ